MIRSLRPFQPQHVGCLSNALLCIVSPKKLASSIYVLNIHVICVYQICHFACRHMQQQTLHRMGKKSPAYLDPQILTRTNLQTSSRGQEVVAYFVTTMRNYRDKEFLVIPFNTGNHWVTLEISTKYDQVWYCDSRRATDPITGD
jgi:hypothetical protein